MADHASSLSISQAWIAVLLLAASCEAYFYPFYHGQPPPQRYDYNPGYFGQPPYRVMAYAGPSPGAPATIRFSPIPAYPEVGPEPQAEPLPSAPGLRPTHFGYYYPLKANYYLPPFLERVVQRIQGYYSVYNPLAYLTLNRPVSVVSPVPPLVTVVKIKNQTLSTTEEPLVTTDEVPTTTESATTTVESSVPSSEPPSTAEPPPPTEPQTTAEPPSSADSSTETAPSTNPSPSTLAVFEVTPTTPDSNPPAETTPASDITSEQATNFVAPENRVPAAMGYRYDRPDTPFTYPPRQNIRRNYLSQGPPY